MKKILKNIVSIFTAMTIIDSIIPFCVNAESDYMKGVGTHFTHFADTEKDLPLLLESGVKTIRDTIYWAHVEKEEGVYNWSDYDWWLKELEDNNIEVYICAVSQVPPY